MQAQRYADGSFHSTDKPLNPPRYEPCKKCCRNFFSTGGDRGVCPDCWRPARCGQSDVVERRGFSFERREPSHFMAARYAGIPTERIR